MKKLWLLVTLLFLAPMAMAQGGYVNVTATVVDPNGAPYANCQGSASFVASPTATQPPTLNGSPFQTDVPIGSCDSFGYFSMTLADNNQVTDGHTGSQASQWRFSICNKGGTPCKQSVLTITLPSPQDISAAIQPMPILGGGGGGGQPLTRFQLTGTPLVAGDFAISGWGSAATITNIAGSDSAFSFTVTASAGPCGLACATVSLTYHDGPWISIQSISAVWSNSGGNATDIEATSTITKATLTYMGLPVAGQSYTISVMVTGQSTVIHGTPLFNPVVQNPQGPQTTGTQPLAVPGLLTNAGGINTSQATTGQLNGSCVVDGVTNTTLAAAITCAGTSGVVEIPMLAVPSFSTATIPSGVTLKFDGPSCLNNTGPLVVNGPIVAPDVQIFCGTGLVTTAAGKLRSVWFPGATVGAQINKAVLSLSAGGTTIEVPNRTTGTITSDIFAGITSGVAGMLRFGTCNITVSASSNVPQTGTSKDRPAFKGNGTRRPENTVLS